MQLHLTLRYKHTPSSPVTGQTEVPKRGDAHPGPPSCLPSSSLSSSRPRPLPCFCRSITRGLDGKGWSFTRCSCCKVSPAPSPGAGPMRPDLGPAAGLTRPDPGLLGCGDRWQVCQRHSAPPQSFGYPRGLLSWAARPYTWVRGVVRSRREERAPRREGARLTW